MTYDEWVAEYNPLHARKGAPYDETMFETYGQELATVEDWAYRHVWTLIQDDGLHIIPGRHWINRLGYFITTQPWAEEDAWALSIEAE